MMPTEHFKAQLGAYRAQVVEAMLALIPDRQPQKYLYGVIADQLKSAGKGFRPALCLATTRAFGGDSARALPSAAALELLHSAFLVHDDVEDESLYRRGRPTLQQRIGVPLAINVGDALNALSVRALRQNLEWLGPALSARIFEEFEHMTSETIEGQAMELGWMRDNDCSTTEDDYLLLVLKKTTWYSFIHPARIGALIAQPERTDLGAFDRFGYFLGAAFQLWDDVLNLTGEVSKYGKEINGDVYEGKRTLMLIHLLANSDAIERRRLEAFLSKPRGQRLPREATWVTALMRERGSIDHARAAAKDFAEAARKELEVAYREARPGPDLDFIRGLVDTVAARDA
ncbi:MAG TPA: polyprenyl synthetase family protein [Polyangiales bacterium]|nr:polyprenyl synthetase family protein [Polyangiales bacterium]